MDVKQIPKLLSLSDSPVGFAGCRNDQTHFECCEYDVIVMDGQSGETVHRIQDDFVKVRHYSLDDSSSDTLYHLQDVSIINDNQWKLRMLLSKIKEKKNRLQHHMLEVALLIQEFLQTRQKILSRFKIHLQGYG